MADNNHCERLDGKEKTAEMRQRECEVREQREGAATICHIEEPSLCRIAQSAGRGLWAVGAEPEDTRQQASASADGGVLLCLLQLYTAPAAEHCKGRHEGRAVGRHVYVSVCVCLSIAVQSAVCSCRLCAARPRSIRSPLCPPPRAGTGNSAGSRQAVRCVYAPLCTARRSHMRRTERPGCPPSADGREHCRLRCALSIACARHGRIPWPPPLCAVWTAVSTPRLYWPPLGLRPRTHGRQQLI